MASERRWEVVPDGEYIFPLWDDEDKTYTLYVYNDGADVQTWSNEDDSLHDDGSPRRADDVSIGDFRLCHLVEAPASAGVSVPEDVAETIRATLYSYREKVINLSKVYHGWEQDAPQLISDVDAALDWLDSLAEKGAGDGT